MESSLYLSLLDNLAREECRAFDIKENSARRIKLNFWFNIWD